MVDDINSKKKKKCISELRPNDLNKIFLYTEFTGSTYVHDTVVVKMAMGVVEGKPLYLLGLRSKCRWTQLQ